jgi:hypothetical protein
MAETSAGVAQRREIACQHAAMGVGERRQLLRDGFASASTRASASATGISATGLLLHAIG